jgi:phospholipase/lecithinase/hemolysin
VAGSTANAQRVSFVEGDSSYLGTEINGGFTWRFAPNTAFDLAAYYLFAGSALDMSESLNGAVVKRSANDAYYATARVRLSF